jgi:prophage tail gpP-like protein
MADAAPTPAAPAPDQLPGPTFNPDEIATVVVEGRKFQSWKSVWVQHRWAEAYPLFRFTSADIEQVPADWQKLQFKPGDEAAIYLGNELAITGVIVTRQTAYSKDAKGIQFQGIGVTWYAARASVIHKTGNFDNKSFMQIAEEVLAPTGIKIIPIGNVNAEPFVKCQVEPGETIWNFLERLARPRGIVMGSDKDGNFLAIDDHTMPISASLVEGVNIISCQAVISIENIFTDYIIRGQTAASDTQNMAAASEQEAHYPGTAKRYSPVLTPAEQPVWSIGELQERAKNESIWHEGTIIEATIVVQGWMRPGTHQLWRAGDDVSVKSPMAMLDMVLKIRTITFTQDRNQGTLTALELVAPWLLKDAGDFDVSNPTAPQAPDANATPAAPVTSPSEPPPPNLEE